MNELLENVIWYRYIMNGIVFVLGASIGSFCMVVGSRGAAGESPWKGRSHCCSCGHELNFIDLLPVFGWIIRGGKCKYCGSALSPTYVIIEAICGAMYALTFERFEVSILTLLYFLMFGFMVITAIYDMELGEISDLYTIPIACFGALIGVCRAGEISLIVSLIGSIMLGLLGLILRNKIGGADIIVLMGIVFTVSILQFAVLLQIMGILGIVYILIKNKFNVKEKFFGVAVRFLPIIYLAYAILFIFQPLIKIR